MSQLQELISETVSIESLAKRLAGKLLRHQEIPLEKETIDLLLKKQILQTTPAIKKNFLFNKCMRCGNESSVFFSKIPCALCNKKHLYCRKCIEMGRVMECEALYFWSGPAPVWPKCENPCSWNGELTAAQQTAADRIKRTLLEKEKEILVWAVAGAGKTEMLFPGITFALETGLRVCIATPRADVVREVKPRLERAFEATSIQALYAGSEDKQADTQLILATTHQLFRFKEAFDVIIIDELDAFPFHSDPSLQFAANRARKIESTMIYLTATPRKKQQMQMKNGKLAHVFVPVRYHGHPLPVPKLKMTYSLTKDLKQNQAPKSFYTWLSKRENPNRQLLIFVPTIRLAEKLKRSLNNEMLQGKFIQNEKELDAVHSEDQLREEKVMAFREKRLKVIITTTILERGVTFPSVDVAILDAGHTVFDEAALVQIAGRAGRSADEPTGEVIFFHDGKTEAMVSAIDMIKQMNKRGGFK